MKQTEMSRFRVRNTVIELQPTVTTQKRIRRQSDNVKQKEHELQRLKESKSRPRSISVPQTVKSVKIEQQRISRTSETKPQGKLPKAFPHKVPAKRSSQNHHKSTGEMLGAQALRTKQKAEQKEREKRQKERQRNLELQRERIQKAASEEAAAMQLQIQATMADPLYPNPQITKHKQRHSVHTTAFSSHLMPLNSQMNHGEKVEVPQRSPSTDCGKPGDPLHPSSGSGGSRFMKWLGFSSTNNGIRKEQRRMSTY
ncbi:hypothetical protein FO519_002549 [Halicephalobus sp. NKZ332]|nr:hypothetical protein FO519_002549 [Halicephalobus sp. NKZ332]